MGRGHTPYGYKIVGGKAEIEEGEAERLRGLYQSYLSGLSLVDAGKSVGINLYQASIKRLLLNRHYLGDEFYPQIIDKEIFDAAVKEMGRRYEYYNKGSLKSRQKEAPAVPVNFKMQKGEMVKGSPYEVAAYIYSLIESEV